MQIQERYERLDLIPVELQENYVEFGESWVLIHTVGLLNKNRALVREVATLKNEIREFRAGKEKILSAMTHFTRATPALKG